MNDLYRYTDPRGRELCLLSPQANSLPGRDSSAVLVEVRDGPNRAGLQLPATDLDEIIYALCTRAGRDVILLERTSPPIPGTASVDVPGGEVGVSGGKVYLDGPTEWTPDEARITAASIATAADEADPHPALPEVVGWLQILRPVLAQHGMNPALAGPMARAAVRAEREQL